MRDLQTWGSRTPRRCEKTDARSSDILIWIVCGIIAAAILAMR